MAIIKGSNKDETLTGTPQNDTLYGLGGNDVIKGLSGADLIYGGYGLDELRGGDGNDSLFGENGSDNLFGGIGDDRLFGGNGNDRLEGENGVDRLFGENGGDRLDGGNGNDRLDGGYGDDTLDGGRGADVMLGGFGNDRYFVDSKGDKVSEAKGAGSDVVYSSIDWALGANVENLSLSGNSWIDGTGNALANRIEGNSGSNVLDGGAGNDYLQGWSGNDVLLGGIGNDTLDAYNGIDFLSGGLGNDQMVFADFASDTANGGAGKDSLLVTGQNQVIDLSKEAISGIETIQFSAYSGSTLKVTAQDVLALSPDSNTLKVDSAGNNFVIMAPGWVETGVVDGYREFTKDGATLQVAVGTAHVEMVNAHIISDAASAARASSQFTAGADLIMVDFGGLRYADWGLDKIDLSGFGVEDKLFFKKHDGCVTGSTSLTFQPNFPAQGNGFEPIRKFLFSNHHDSYSKPLWGWAGGTRTAGTLTAQDAIVRVAGKNSLQLSSKFKTNFFSYWYTETTTKTPSGLSIAHHHTITNKHATQGSGHIMITGVPADLPPDQYVFV